MRLLVFITVFFISITNFAQENTIYQFKAQTIQGEEFDFANLKGKKVLIVNTASECMLTTQFKKLQELYEEYGGDDFEIIGFPCNDFGKQDPNDNNEILDFCTNKYQITFQMMEKISIKGNNPHPIYKWLTSSEENGSIDAKVTWNFQKFLINEKGEVIDYVAPIGNPKGKRIMEWLQTQ